MPSRRRQLVQASRPLLRSSVFGGVAVLMAAFAHVTAGGPAPDPAGILLASLLVTLTHRAVLAGRERSALVLGAALVATQYALHVVFLGWSTGAPVDAAGMGAHHAMPADPGWAMPAAHALACLALGFLLRPGEAALWSAARRTVTTWCLPLVRALATALGTPPVPAPHPGAPAAGVRGDPALRRTRWAIGGRRWRGPPRRTPHLA